jgi:ferritin-like metal-binding protein YciE
MSRDAIHALEEQLRATAPTGVQKLTDAELADLAEAIRAARHRQAQALDQAAERALGRIPRLLRGPIRKVAG